MTKITLINPDSFFQESEKAIQIINEYEREVKGRLPADYKLKIAKETLEKVKTREDFEELTQEIKNLEFEVRYGEDSTPAVPEEYQHKIAFNRVQEEEQLDQELQKQKELLHELMLSFEEPLINVLENIERLEKRKLIGVTVDSLLEKNIIFNPSIPDVSYFLQTSSSPQMVVARKTNEICQTLFKNVKEIASEPAKKDGVLKPGIIKKILGGNK